MGAVKEFYYKLEKKWKKMEERALIDYLKEKKGKKMKNKITDSELLLIDIYDHFLCREGDRSNYPLPQIEKHLNTLGIDMRDEAEEKK